MYVFDQRSCHDVEEAVSVQHLLCEYPELQKQTS